MSLRAGAYIEGLQYPEIRTATEQSTPIDQATPIWQVCLTPTPDLTCYLITLSSSGSGRH
ncbi:hypothetical protein [Nocardia sp. NPDC004604]|uniref:hypothetical protein n=1 Tax=Nocardia sp. NPDC004604 TaxID=3157013 RepID=UPI0033ACC6D9